MSGDPTSTTDFHLRDLSRADWDELTRTVGEFADALRRGERPEINDLLPAGGPELRRAVLVEMIHEELEYRLQAGEPAGAGEYFARFPELGDDPDAARELVRAEDRFRRISARVPRIVGKSFGRFEVMEEWGRGSFGVVYRCRDAELGRIVAVKVPKPGMLVSSEEEDRFLREARSAARLDHPNIVPLYEAGRIDGVPYLVGAFIPGTTLTAWAEAAKPSPRRAAELVATLAEALDHAHGRGIIHRDIKPSNVLIDPEGRPHLTDFGLAWSPTTDRTLTRAGDVLGTPAFMPPEQARGDSHKVDARGDVYSLGVVLYELLAGALPFTGKGRMLLLQVLEDEPRPPRRLNDAIPRDLETVCLKAMAKEPSRRYATAADLADDLGRFLRREPVQARPIHPLVAFGRRCRRKPVLAGTVAALVVTAAASFVLVTRAWLRADQYRLQAEESLDDARQRQARLLQTLKAGHLTTMKLAQLAYYPRNSRPASEIQSQGAWADGLLIDYEHFIEQLRTEPTVRAQFGSTVTQYAYIANRLGKRKQAIAAWREAAGVFERLARDEPENGDHHRQLAECAKEIRDLRADNIAPGESARLARLTREQWRRALTLYERRLRLVPGDIETRRSLAYVALDLAGFDAETAPETEAIHFLEIARDSFEKLVRATPGDSAVRVQLARTRTILAEKSDAKGPWTESRRNLETTRAELEGLLQADNGDDGIRADLARAHYGLASVHRDEHRQADSLQAFQEAARVWEELLRRSPTNPAYQVGLAEARFWAGASLDRLNRTAEALGAYQAAADAFTRALPADDRQRRPLAASYHKIGTMLNELDRPADALAAYHRALELREALRREPASPVGDLGDCAGTWHRLGETLERLDRGEEAATAYRRGIALQVLACRRDPKSESLTLALEGRRADLARLERKLAAGPPVVSDSR